MFKWNGSDLGDITILCLGFYYCTRYKTTVILLKGGMKCTAHKYKNNTPLIADELKTLFNLEKVGRHKAILFDNHVLLGKIADSEEFQTIKPKNVNNCDLESIRTTIAFRYVIGLTKSVPSVFYFRKNDCISYTEVTFNFQSTSGQAQLRQWFENTSLSFYVERLIASTNIYQNMINDNDRLKSSLQLLRHEIDRIVYRVDSNVLNLGIQCTSRASSVLTI